MLRRFLLLLLLLASGSAMAAPEKNMADLYSLITQQQGWLNTSRALTPADLKGRIILLDFWTYCCINCMHVIPDLQYLEQKFGSDLTVIGVHSAKFRNESDSENIRQAILRYDLHHPVVNDFDFSTWNAFGVHAWPTFILINPDGLMENIYAGEGNRAAVERDIEQLKRKYAGRINSAPLPISLEKDKQPPTVLSFPGKLAYTADFKGKPALFVSDSGHQRVVVMGLDGVIIDVIGSGAKGAADGAFEQTEFHTPQGVAYQNGVLYIADTDNHLLRAANFATRQVMTLAGTGQQGHERSGVHRPARDMALASPWDVAFYPDAGHLAIAMAGTHQLWSYDIAGKTLGVIAGNGNESIDDGIIPDNSLAQPSGLSAAGGKLYFVDAETSSLRVLADGAVHTLIGTGLFDFGYKTGGRDTALMQHPLGLAATDSGVYVADSYNHSIRYFDPVSGKLSNFAGHGIRGNKDGALASAEFNEPNAIIHVPRSDKFYVADTNNNAIRVIDTYEGTVSTLKVSEKIPEAEFSSDLPNVEASRAVVQLPLAVTLQLQPGWHVNKEAPSGLALFDMKAARRAVAVFDTAAITTQALTMPALPAGEYRLQGTVYYCEDKAGAQCLLKSFDVALEVKAGGDKALVLKLN